VIAVTSPLDTQQVPQLARHFRMQWEEAQQCHVLLYPEGMVKLSGSASEIMNKINGLDNIDQIIIKLETAFPGNDLRADVVEFLQTAEQRGWIKLLHKTESAAS
jgi:pyrroloquinoline quinone biosynthesis protein D